MTTKTSKPPRAGAVVIGAGPGGYACAIRLAQLGVDTVVVEAGELGGVCLNVGCIPSKALITASKRYAELASHLPMMGITFDDPAAANVDLPKMQSWKRGVVKKLTRGVGQLLEGNGVSVVRGRARLADRRTVVVSGPDGETTLTSDAIVLATGSRPIEIPGFGFDGDRVLDSTGALALEELPKRLVVIGGGYIGLELGGVFARLGTELTVVEMADQLLPGFDADIVRLVERKLRRHGAKILCGAKAAGYRPSPDGGVVIEVESASGERLEVEADRVLVTVGRRPNTEELGLEAAGVSLDARGFVQVDAGLSTSVAGIYAIGDVVGGMMLAHKASAEAEICAEAIAGKDARFEPRAIPAVVFTDPEIATVGLSEREAKEAGHTVRVGKYPFAGLGRALAIGETDGFVRVIVDAGSTEILGCQIVGPEASDLIAEATLAIEMGAFADDVGLTIHAHPTLSEAFMEAAKGAIGQAIHLINRG